MSTESLRPQAKCALRRASTGGVQGDEWIQQERDVVTSNIQIALIYVGHVRQSVEVFDLRTVRIVDNTSILSVGDSQDLIERLALCELHHRVIEFSATDKVDRVTFIQCFVRRGRDR